MVANMLRNEIFALNPQHDNAAMQYAAYRQFVLWQQGQRHKKGHPQPLCLERLY